MVVEQNLFLEEYAKMFVQQGFENKIKELENKKERMKALVLCMGNTEERFEALEKINSLKSITENRFGDLNEKIDEYTAKIDPDNLFRRRRSLDLELNSNKFKRMTRSCSNIYDFFIK